MTPLEQSNIISAMKVEVGHIKEMVEDFRDEFKDYKDKQERDFKSYQDEMETTIKEHGKEILELRNWKIQFVAKFTAYSSIALFLGTILSNVLVDFIKNLFL